MDLIADSISRSFAGVHALSDVNMKIAEGEILGVIGPNGSGKTTLINVLSGVIPPSDGRVRLGEESWASLPSCQVSRRGIGRTFQTIRVFTEMTVLENVEVAACAHKATRGWRRRRQVSREALDRLDLAPYADTVVSELSYGLQRKVEIARAIAPRPHFVLLDEPAAGLNEAESDELLATLLDLREDYGFGVMLVDHDLRLLMRCTDRICVLCEGRVLADGKPQDVRHNPDVVRAYIGGPAPSAAA
jgi:ABC-type branched-subunit amino acid transport system ATPase component